MNKQESTVGTIKFSKTENLICAFCFARLSTEDGHCANCSRIRGLELENYVLSQRTVQALDQRQIALERTVKLQMVIDDLSQRLAEQAQSFKTINSDLREAERERTIWKQHATLSWR